MKKATALLLNWKRPENLEHVIRSLRSQSVGIDIFLWNNNPEDARCYDVDLQIDSSQNLMCWPRWFMANYCTTDYVFSLDDDLCMNDEKVIQDCIEYAEQHQASIGYTGVILDSEQDYWSSTHILRPKRSRDVEVDIIKGRFIFCHRSSLQSLKIFTQHNIKKYGSRIEDDIIVSACLGQKIIPAFLRDRLRELPSPDALYDQKTHEESRQEAVEAYFRKK